MSSSDARSKLRDDGVTSPSNVKHQRARATALRANGTISLRALCCIRQFIFVWFLLMGVYLLCIGFAGSALAVCPSYVNQYRVKLAAIFKTSEWFVLSGLISFPIYVIGFVIFLWAIGEEL